MSRRPSESDNGWVFRDFFTQGSEDGNTLLCVLLNDVRNEFIVLKKGIRLVVSLVCKARMQGMSALYLTHVVLGV